MKRPRVKRVRFVEISGIASVVIICDNGDEVVCAAETFVILADQARQYLDAVAERSRGAPFHP
jgi:hypothetical protein